MKLLLDENLSPTQAQWLREDGFDAVAITELGLSGASDEKVREAAIEQVEFSSQWMPTLQTSFGSLRREHSEC